MIRVVVDPGVFVSGLITGTGSPTAVALERAEAGRIELVVCPALLTELEAEQAVVAVWTPRDLVERSARA